MTQAPELTSFAQRSYEVAREFIHTVVLVDDKAFPERGTAGEGGQRDEVGPVVEPEGVVDVESTDERRGGPGEALVAVPLPATVPSAESSLPATVPSDSGVVKVDSGVTGGDRASVLDAEHLDPEELDAKALIRIFAKDGLVCGVLDPEDYNEALEGTIAAAKRADVIVLDWVVKNVAGELALRIIEKVLARDREHDGRLRLIAIYTGSPALQDIIQRIKERLEGVGLDDFVCDEAGLALTNSSTRIVILAKPHARIPPQSVELHQRRTEVAKLPERLCQEFSRLANGLIPNVALRSFAVLRDHTHEVLRYLHSRLDAPFVAHRALLPQPDDAINHAVDLVAGEITALLHAYEVGDEANANMTETWIKSRDYKFEAEGYVLPPATDARDVGLKIARDGAVAWVDGAKGLSNKQAQKWKRDFHRDATRFFGGAEVKGSERDSELAVATSQVRRYEKGQPRPRLTLGTIIKRAGVPEEPYLVCLQPRCDSVRIQDARKFLFLPAFMAKSGAFNLVVHDTDGYESLRLHQRPYEMVVLEFMPTSGTVVRAERNDQEALVFKDAGGEVYRWIAQLKDSEAQRIANSFAAKLARVGLNEVEWLRRSAQSKDDE